MSACVSECNRSAQRSRRSSHVLTVPGDVRPEKNINQTTTVGHSSMLAHTSRPFFLSFSSRRVQISGPVDTYPVPAITVDIATDISFVSRAWLMSHPTLGPVSIQPVSPSAVALRAVNGSPLDILGFVIFSLTLRTIAHDVEALVVPSLGPDSRLVDNNVMPKFGAVLDWETKLCHLHLLVNLSQQFIVLANPASRPANPLHCLFPRP